MRPQVELMLRERRDELEVTSAAYSIVLKLARYLRPLVFCRQQHTDFSRRLGDSCLWPHGYLRLLFRSLRHLVATRSSLLFSGTSVFALFTSEYG